MLPNEILLLVFAQLSLDVLCTASCVNSHWRRLILNNDQSLFADMTKLFPLMQPIRPQNDGGDSYRARFLRAHLNSNKKLPNQIIHTRLFYELQLLGQEPTTIDIVARKVHNHSHGMKIHTNQLIPSEMVPLFKDDIIYRQWATDQSSVSYVRDMVLVRGNSETDLITGSVKKAPSDDYDIRKCYIEGMCVFSVGPRTYVVRLPNQGSKCLSAQMSEEALYCIMSGNENEWTVVRTTTLAEQTEVVIGDQELTPLLQVLHGHVFVEQPSVSYTSTVYYVDMNSCISYKLYRTDGMGSGLPCAVLDGFVYVYYGVDRRRRFNQQMIKLYCDFGSKTVMESPGGTAKRQIFDVPVFVANIQYTDTVDLAGGTHTKILSDSTGNYCLSHDFVKTSGHLWKPRDHEVLVFDHTGDDELFQICVESRNRGEDTGEVHVFKFET